MRGPQEQSPGLCHSSEMEGPLLSDTSSQDGKRRLVDRVRQMLPSYQPEQAEFLAGTDASSRSVFAEWVWTLDHGRSWIVELWTFPLSFLVCLSVFFLFEVWTEVQRTSNPCTSGFWQIYKLGPWNQESYFQRCKQEMPIRKSSFQLHLNVLTKNVLW